MSNHPLASMWFCPTCANILRFQSREEGHRLFCSTCPYIYPIVVPEKAADESETEVTCPVCGHNKAYVRTVSPSPSSHPLMFPSVSSTVLTWCGTLDGWLGKHRDIPTTSQPDFELYRCMSCTHIWD